MIDFNTAFHFLRCRDCGRNAYTCACTAQPTEVGSAREDDTLPVAITPPTTLKKKVRNSEMRFEFQGTTYHIDFSRPKRTARRWDPNAGPFGSDGLHEGAYVDKEVSHPDTRVDLRIVTPEKTLKEWPVFQTAQIGCWHGDRYTPEAGRRRALVKLCSTIDSYDLRAAIWKTYHSRPGGLFGPTPVQGTGTGPRQQDVDEGRR